MKIILSHIISRGNLTALVIASSLYGSTQAGFGGSPQWVTWDVSAGGNGHSYLAVPGFSGLTWTMADQLAQAQGGYLATITSAAENNFVFSLVNDPEFFTATLGSGPALGGMQMDGAPEPAGGWYWETAEPWSYTDWSSRNPDNGQGYVNENRLNFFSDISNTPANTWNDIRPDDPNLGGYVIEVVPEPNTCCLLLGWGGVILARRLTKRE